MFILTVGIQKTDVLIRAQRGGFIRCHTLSTEQKIISSTHRAGCVNMLHVTVGLEDPGEMPLLLEEKQSRKLVRDLGSDLEQLGQLKSFQVANIGYGLTNAGFVDSFEIKEANQNELSVYLGNHSFAATQSTLFPPLPPSLPMNDPKLLNSPDNIPLDVVPDPWKNITHDYSHFQSGEAEQLLDEDMILDESTLLTPPETTLLTTYPGLGIASPTETVSTPGLNGTTSYYSTPSSMCLDSSPGETLAGVRSAIRKQPRAKGIPIKPNSTILLLLQSCGGGKLSEKHVQEIFKAERSFSSQTSRELLRPLLNDWDNNMSLGLHALGLPVVWLGIQGMVNYLRVLDADERDSFLDPVARRIGLVLLYFNYNELCRHPGIYCPAPIPKAATTYVLDCILNAYHDDPRISKLPQSRRNKISANYAKRGKWWWTLAGSLGVGILLIGDDQLIRFINNATFTDIQMDVLITLALNTRPGTIRIFHELEPVVKPLIFGQVTEDLRQAILNDRLGFFGRNEMAHVQAEDEAAVACQRTEKPWTKVDAKHIAMEKMTEILASVLVTQ
ncbi:serine-proline rich protein [Aspergillus ibericus CBS 121593]|uniref:Serine-proline rich protein n=1 Tax=Aspergillus ibericus CBS 121593 TaxID=1448316 RepID=A0A395GIG4_9EURO|nr:serine-proline rich protein [Aspergillus ibericus CBS 121593]RAK94828.1 serine-proline rich protein [Aspergillus ibericus CBS 121593]